MTGPARSCARPGTTCGDLEAGGAPCAQPVGVADADAVDAVDAVDVADADADAVDVVDVAAALTGSREPASELPRQPLLRRWETSQPGSLPAFPSRSWRKGPPLRSVPPVPSSPCHVPSLCSCR